MSVSWRALAEAWALMNQSDYTIPLLSTLSAHEKLALQQQSSVFYALIEELQKTYTTPLLLTRKDNMIFVAACTGIKEQPGYRLLEALSLKKQKGATVGKPMAPPGSIKI